MKKKPNSSNHITTKHAFYALLIGTSMIMLWRGIWGLLDFYLFPDNRPVSYMTSITIGLIILYSSGRLVKKLT